ncbi:MAG: LapA family protein [Spirulinaceae cyanobacterium SM2_1_0]|nr:LapA family protein [Spirulinaceae cyanobacterium SM2_1_0]
MQVLSGLLVGVMIAAWLVAIAVISIQNVTPISLHFFLWQTVELPFGIALAFSVSAGLVLGAFLPLFRPGGRATAIRRRPLPDESSENWG